SASCPERSAGARTTTSGTSSPVMARPRTPSQSSRAACPLACPCPRITEWGTPILWRRHQARDLYVRREGSLRTREAVVPADLQHHGHRLTTGHARVLA